MKKLIAILLLTALLTACRTEPALSTEELPPETGESSSTPVGESTEDVTAPSTEPLPEVIVNEAAGFGKNTIAARSHYSVREAAPDDENMTAVIAVDSDNNPIFENRHLQAAFWMEYMNMLSTYGNYVSLIGLDPTIPLYAQNESDEKTWEVHFLEYALRGLSQNYALSSYAYANGYEPSEEDLAAVEDITDPDGDFATTYQNQGFPDADTFIQFRLGDGTDAKSYQEYYRMYLAAATCYQNKQTELKEALSEEEILAYYEENRESYEAQGKVQINNASVRHILIQPAGEETDWTEESWAAAEAEAQAIYEQWQADPTEDNFAALASEHTTDPGSKENGGLYENVAPGEMVTEFNDWCFDESRVTGDHGIVKTSYGYHIMYFVDRTDTRSWYDTAAEDMIYEQIQSFVDECVEKYPILIDYTAIRIFDLVTANNAAPVG